MKRKVALSFLLVFMLSILCSISIYAVKETETGTETETEVGFYTSYTDLIDDADKYQGQIAIPEFLVIQEKAKGTPLHGQTVNDLPKTLVFMGDGYELFDVESEQFRLLLNVIVADVRKDALNGLNILSGTRVTLDHIRLDQWGEFFNKYYGKSLTSFPMGNIKFEFAEYKFEISNNEAARKLILNYIIPPCINAIQEVSVNYPANRYALNVTNGALLKDYVCDLTSVRLVETVTPFDGVEEYLFYNVGSYYGMGLSEKYVSILRGYIEGNERGYDRPVQGSVPGCVNVLAYITLISDVSNYSISDKILSDFTLYKDLAITLDTHQLVDTTDLSTDYKQLYYSDYKLVEDNLIIAPIANDVVVIQPTYLECFSYGGYDRNFGSYIDVTPFVSTGEHYFSVVRNGATQKVPMEYFIDEMGKLDTRLGNAPFLIYYTNYKPYDLLINWAYNQAGSSFADSNAKNAFVDAIRKEMKAAGRQSDFDAYMQAAGQRTDSMNMIIRLVVIGIVIIAAIVIALIVRKKLKDADMVAPNGNSDLLFHDDYDDDDDDDDDEGGGFELH